MLTAEEERLVAAVDEAALTDLLRGLVSRPSENPGGSEEAVARHLADACRDAGLHAELEDVRPGRPNAYATYGPAGPGGLLLLGHTDVVPAGEGWTHPPYEAALVDGRVIGRGAADMKGGLAAAVAAMAALRRSGVRLSAPVTLAAVIDEEESGLGVQALLRRGEPAARAAIVPEPTELQPIVACRGNCYVQVDVHGRSAHAGTPEEGANAIYGAARVVEAVRALHGELALAPHPVLGPAGWSVGLIEGGSGTAMVPDRCRISIDRRLLPGQSGEDARDEIAAAIARLGLEADGLHAHAELLMEIPSFELDAGHELVRAVVAGGADAGAPARPVGGWTAACDGGYLMRDAAIPTLVFGPGSVVDQAHRPDESVPVAEVVTAARTYALVASRLLAVTP